MSNVVLVGHCRPDSSYLRLAVLAADPAAQVIRANDEAELAAALEHAPALLLVNRRLDGDFADSSGIGLIRRLRRSHPHVKAMLVSNYADAQEAAVAAGALEGFGKRHLSAPRTIELLRSALPGGVSAR
jgi:DNA-binding NarL/FixJ family response regulator